MGDAVRSRTRSREAALVVVFRDPRDILWSHFLHCRRAQVLAGRLSAHPGGFDPVCAAMVFDAASVTKRKDGNG